MVVALAAAVGLGLWQLHAWQAGRDADTRDLIKAAAKPLSQVMTGDDPFPGAYLGQPVTFRGTWLRQGTLYVADRDLNGKRSSWVMTPVLVGTSAIAVVRGWSTWPESPTASGPVPGSG